MEDIMDKRILQEENKQDFLHCPKSKLKSIFCSLLLERPTFNWVVIHFLTSGGEFLSEL